MKPLLSTAIVSLSVAFTALLALPVSANAQSDYPWCAHLSTGQGFTQCTYATVQQCKAFLGNQNGTCELNPRFAARFAAGRKIAR
jgi:hypothetical protein